MRTPLKIFMFGYWGWGNATAHLVQACNAVEDARGFKPPMFVDIRIHRNVRAAGFHEDQFQKATGPENYEWMPTLGNLSERKDLKAHLVDTHICLPDDAGRLLNRAYELAQSRQRIIYFCSCPVPSDCHRLMVANLIKREAQRIGRPIEVVEWPGGSPRALRDEVPVTNRSFPTSASPNLYLRQVRDFPLATYAGLPVGSRVCVTIGSETRTFAVSPARYSAPKRRWYLETLRNEGYVAVAATDKAVATYRQKYDYEPIKARRRG